MIFAQGGVPSDYKTCCFLLYGWILPFYFPSILKFGFGAELSGSSTVLVLVLPRQGACLCMKWEEHWGLYFFFPPGVSHLTVNKTFPYFFAIKLNIVNGVWGYFFFSKFETEVLLFALCLQCTGVHLHIRHAELCTPQSCCRYINVLVKQHAGFVLVASPWLATKHHAATRSLPRWDGEENWGKKGKSCGLR